MTECLLCNLLNEDCGDHDPDWTPTITIEHCGFLWYDVKVASGQLTERSWARFTRWGARHSANRQARRIMQERAGRDTDTYRY